MSFFCWGCLGFSSTTSIGDMFTKWNQSDGFLQIHMPQSHLDVFLMTIPYFTINRWYKPSAYEWCIIVLPT